MTYFLDHPDEMGDDDRAGHTDEEIERLQERGDEGRERYLDLMAANFDRREYEGNFVVEIAPHPEGTAWEQMRRAGEASRAASEASGRLFVDLENPFDPDWASKLGVDLTKAPVFWTERLTRSQAPM